MSTLNQRQSHSPFVLLVPNSPAEAIEIIDQSRALRLACTNRHSSGQLAEEWSVAGIYVLLWPIRESGDFTCYVGKGNLKTRVSQHRAGKEGWTRALLVASNQKEGFNSAEIGWLEGQLHSQILNSAKGEVTNKQEPGDDTISAHDKSRLYLVVEGVVQVLRAIGYELAEESEVDPPNRRMRRKDASGVTLPDLLARGLIQGGDELVSTNGQWPASAKVTPQGTIEYLGDEYLTPSAAGVAVRSGATNGWTFWAVVRGGQRVPLAVLRAECEASRPRGE